MVSESRQKEELIKARVLYMRRIGTITSKFRFSGGYMANLSFPCTNLKLKSCLQNVHNVLQEAENHERVGSQRPGLWCVAEHYESQPTEAQKTA